MLLGGILHPEILRGLGQAGHGAKILIADGNYPLATRSSGNSVRVYLNLAPGKVTVRKIRNREAFSASAASYRRPSAVDKATDRRMAAAGKQ
jgi:L-fucose mutarotase/ribose pyranase (RbsD/FucU family)